MKKQNAIILAFVGIIILTYRKNMFSFISNIIKRFEGNKLTAYQDTGGVWTIGFGSIYHYDKNRPVQQGDVITMQQAENWLNREISEKKRAIEQLLRVPQNAKQIAALTSFAYNVGVNAFKNSTMLRLINSGADKNTVAAQFDRWVFDNGQRITGLVNRRKAEKRLYLS